MAQTYVEEMDGLKAMVDDARIRLRANASRSIDDINSKIKDIWAETPIGPKEFITSKSFIGDSSKDIKEQRVWRILRDDLEAIFSGPDKYGRPSYFPACNVYLNISGIGSGKSTFIALLNAYYIYLLHCLKNPVEYYGFLDATTLLFLNVAPKIDKAHRIVYQKLMAIIKGMAWFRDSGLLPEERIESVLKFYGRGADTSKMSVQEIHYMHKQERKGFSSTLPILMVRPGSSQMSEATGEDLLVGVIDEACSDGGFETIVKDYCEDIFMNMNERRTSRFMDDGLVAMISSAGNEDRFAERYAVQFEQHCLERGKDFHKDMVDFIGNKVYYKRRASYDCSPKYQVFFDTGDVFTYNARREMLDGTIIENELTIPGRYRERFEQNPEEALKNVCALPQVVTGKYITEWHKIIRHLSDREDPCPDNGRDEALTPRMAQQMLPADFGVMDDAKDTWHYCHIDLATGGTTSSGRDGCGFAVAHTGPPIERHGILYPTVVIDLAVRFKAKPKRVSEDAKGRLVKDERELDFSEIRDFLFFLDDHCGFKFAKITFDGWQSKDSIQILNKKGYLAEKASCTRESFEAMKQLWYDGRLDIFRDDHALWELKRLVDYGTKIEKSSGASDDEIESIARVCEMCIEADEPDIPKRRAMPLLGSPGIRGGGSRQRFGGRSLPGQAMRPATAGAPRPRM